MISFEDAKAKAKSLCKTVNACNEYDKGYRFFDKSSEADGENGVVIVKENGDALTFIQFITRYHPNPKFKPVSMGMKVRK